MMEASPSAPFVVAEPDLLLELMVIARSNLGAPSSKPFEHQWFLKTASRALTAIIGTEGHQSAHSGTESPEKVPNYVLEAFTAAALATEPAALSSTETARCRPRRFARPCRQRIRGHAGGSGPAESQG
jgi:hypothetical protein